MKRMHAITPLSMAVAGALAMGVSAVQAAEVTYSPEAEEYQGFFSVDGRGELEVNQRAGIRARDNHESLVISREAHGYHIRTKPDDSKKPDFRLEYNTLGPRYAGEEIAQAAISGGILGTNASLVVQKATGLDWLNNQDGEGGDYRAVFGQATRAMPGYSVTGSLSYMKYEQGGDTRFLGLGGEIKKAGAKVSLAELPLSFHYTHTRQTDEIGLFGMEEDKSANVLGASVTDSRELIGGKFQAKLEAGHSVSGDRSGTELSAYDGRFSYGELQIGYTRDLGPIGLETAMGARAASSDALGVYQGFIGGLNRGSSVQSGAASGKQAAWGSVRFLTPLAHVKGAAFQGFAGVNGGHVVTNLDQSEHISSGEVGVSVEYKAARLDLSVARTISASDTIDKANPDDTRINLAARINF